MPLSFSFIKEVYRLASIVRYNTQQRIKDESVATHSFYTSLFTKMLYDSLGVSKEVKLAAIELALVHDASEIVTNDITYDAKQAMPEVVPILEGYEKRFTNEHFPDIVSLMFGDENALIRTIVKAADILSVIQYCGNEVDLGNEGFRKFLNSAYERYYEQLRKLGGMGLHAKE